jgi:Cu2+-exporting ATPase
MSAHATTLVACKHCGIPFQPTERRPDFCCAGCQFVNHLLQKRGFQEFYQFGETQTPAANFVFHARDFDWLRDLQKETELAFDERRGHGRLARESLTPSLTLDVQGISCAGCVWLLEAVFTEHPGAISCRVNSTSGTVELRWQPGQCDLAAYASDIQRFGYLLGPHDGSKRSALRPLTLKLGICAALAMNAMLFTLPRYLGIDTSDSLVPIFDAISLALATLSMLVGGTYFFRRALAALGIGALHIDLPISLGLLAAYTGSVIAWLRGDHSFAYFDFISIFTFLMLLGRWMQERTLESNRQRLLGMKITPGKVQKNNAPAAAESLVQADHYAISKGRIVPVRSRLLSAPATFALDWITGEPAPRLFQKGSIIPAGARNISSDPIDLEALEAWTDSRLASLLQIESGNEWRNAAMQKLIRTYLSAVLIIAALGFAAWGLSTGDWFRATQVIVSILVVSCPCAIGVALPLLDDIAAARMQSVGIYIKEGSLWPRLRKVKNILFDKTGTLTLETLALANPETLASLTPSQKSTLLHLVESSLHPVAACLREALLTEGIEPNADGNEVQEIAGLGLQSGPWKLGRASWALSPVRQASRLSSPPTGTLLTHNSTPVANFSFHEQIRPAAKSQIHSLRSSGHDIYLLSGDQSSRAAAMAHSLDLPADHAFGDLTPEDKARLVRDRWAADSLMIGDGANDSHAFDAALCRGTPSIDAGLLEHKSDFYILGASLAGLTTLFLAAKKHLTATRAVFAFAITYNACAVAASLAGHMNPLVAAVIMPLSSLASIAIVLGIFQLKKNQPATQP